MDDLSGQSGDGRDPYVHASMRPMRKPSGRFPIKVTSSSTQLDEHLMVPPMPPKQHSLRGQQTAAMREASAKRNGTSTVGSSSERLRSNSESVLQATRTKRMGMVTRKNGELAPLDEQRSSKSNHSHLRGLSHGSLLEDKAMHKQSSPSGSIDLDRSRDHFVRRLSSLPERRRDPSKADPIVEGAKGVLYGLYQVHPHISNLIAFVRDASPKRSSLERVLYNATSHVEELDREIQKFEAREEEDESTRSNEGIKNACITCVKAYQIVGTQLLQNTTKIAVGGDQRFVRTLLLLVYGGLVEIRNACRILPVQMQEKPFGVTLPQTGTIRPTGHLRPQVNGSLFAKMKGHLALDSSSSIRSGLLSSNAIGTPMSSDGFTIPATPSAVSLSRMNSQTMDDAEEEQLFERIFIGLRIATETATTNLPLINDYFLRRIDYYRQTEHKPDLALWLTLHQACTTAIKESEDMRARLSTIKIREPAVRGQRSFWELANAFVRGFVELALRIRNAKESQLIPIDVLQALRPVQKAVKEVGMQIETSPWRTLSKPSAASHQQWNRDPAAVMSNPAFANSTTYFTAVPATPLSAALGPAAQATIPSTPLTAHPHIPGHTVGYERADSLLSMPARSLTASVTENYHGLSGIGMGSAVLSPVGLRKDAKMSQ